LFWRRIELKFTEQAVARRPASLRSSRILQACQMLSKRLILILLLAALVRAGHVAAIWNTPILDVPIIDSKFYHSWAASLAAEEAQPKQLFFMSPLYPYFLSVLYRIFGAHPRVAVVVQLLMGVFLVFLINRLGTRIFDEKVGLLTAALAALYRPFVYYESVLLSATLILCLNGLALLLILSPRKRPTDYVAAGLLLGLSALARPNVLLFGLLALGYLLFKSKSERRLAFYWILGFALILGPVAYRNYQVSGRLVLATAGLGMNFYAGNNAEAQGIYSEAPFIRSAEPEFEEKDYLAEATRRTGKDLDAVEASQFWLRQGLFFILEKPGRYVGLWMRKFFLFFHSTEIPNNLSLYAVSAFSFVLKLLPFTFGLLAPFGAAYWLLNHRKMKGTLIHVYGLSYLAATLLFFAASEYRLPILLILLPCSAAALLEIWKKVKQHEAGQIVRLAVFTLLFALVMNMPMSFTTSLTSPRMDFFNMGITLQEGGRHEEAVGLLKRSLSVDPSFAAAHIALGESYLQLGQSEAAQEEFRRGGAPMPQSPQQP